jgi:signal transduction histidine kinase
MARLTGEASHELRTPVALIRTTAEVALSRERPAADYRQALTDVLDHAERMTTIVSDLLVLARADAGVEAPESEVADVDLTATVRAAVREMEPAADARGLTLNVEAADAALRTPGHADALRRLLVILLDNALKYTNTGGAVTVRVAAEGHHAIIDVSDTGIGIPAAERERVFDRFYRGADARARIDGSGLGLAIARGIVLRHHGAITIGPGPAGRGSTVRVELPFAAPAV